MSAANSHVEKSLFERFPEIIHPFLRDVMKREAYTPGKLENFSLNQQEERELMPVLRSYPYYLVIDPTNICNLRCPLCPTWQDTDARPKGKMDLLTFSRILDEAGPYLFALNLCNWGEPFLNPDLPSMIRYAKKYNTVVGTSTNLNYLPDDYARELVESGIDVIVISLDGITQESYSRYRKGGKLSTVFGNLEKLVAQRNPHMKFPLIMWQFLVNRYNEHEIEKAQNMAHEMDIHFLPSSMRTSMGKELLFPLYERVKEMADWLPEDPAYNRYAYDIGPETRTPKETCTWLWHSMVVNWDGSVTPCCGVYEKKWDFGTCHVRSEENRQTLHEAWNSPRYKSARTVVAAYMRKSPELPSLQERAEKEDLICSKCIKYGFLED